jgi:DNA-binding transcriptional regulator GbsR (MarR family)
VEDLIMDKPTIQALLKIAQENLKVAREQWREINDLIHKTKDLEEAQAKALDLDDAQAEVFAQEEIVRFLKAYLPR